MTNLRHLLHASSGDSLPDQTRKYVAYFSEEMRAILDASGLRFEPVSGEVFSGLVQLGYLGTGPRGDTTNKDFLDPYAGFYSHHPETTYCAQDGVGFINVDWNVHDKDGPVANGEVLTIVMPHQVSHRAEGGYLFQLIWTALQDDVSCRSLYCSITGL